MTESASETSVVYQTGRRHIPLDFLLQIPVSRKKKRLFCFTNAHEAARLVFSCHIQRTAYISGCVCVHCQRRNFEHDVAKRELITLWNTSNYVSTRIPLPLLLRWPWRHPNNWSKQTACLQRCQARTRTHTHTHTHTTDWNCVYKYIYIYIHTHTHTHTHTGHGEVAFLLAFRV